MKSVRLKKSDIVEITRCPKTGSSFKENESSFQVSVGEAIDNGDFDSCYGTMLWSAVSIDCSDYNLNGRRVLYRPGVASVMIEDEYE